MPGGPRPRRALDPRAGGLAMNAFGGLPNLISGSAGLDPSTRTCTEDVGTSSARVRSPWRPGNAGNRERCVEYAGRIIPSTRGNTRWPLS